MDDRIIVVDDEREIADLIGLYLENDGYEVHKFLNGADALSFVEKCEPALAVLDVMLPDTDGFALLRKMREKHDFPIIMLTARVTDSDKILGLTIGADDYITKPFGAGELLARIRTAIRHTRTGLANETIATTGKFKSGDLEIDYDKHQVLVEGKNVGLTQNELHNQRAVGARHARQQSVPARSHGKHPPQDRKKSGRASVYIHRDRRGLQNGRGRLIIYPEFTKIHPDCGIISIYRSFFNQKGW